MIKKFILFGVLALIGPATIHAQEQTKQIATNDWQEIDAESEQILRALDSLTQLTFFEKSTPKSQKLNKYGFKPNDVPSYPDSVYAFRIKHMGTGLNLSYNSHVRAYIELYANKRRGSTERLLGLSQVYFPIFEEVLEQYNLPHFLKYLAVVESALNPNAVSRVGATGIWQFMYSTGKMYNLNVNYYIDERKDPILASHAAAQFFKDLYAVYDDWLLVLAAYNCGPGNVNKAIRKANGVKDYWAIRQFLPVETRGYVPAFIAATYVMHYAAEHNLYAATLQNFPIISDTVNLKGPLHFKQIAELTDIDIQTLMLLNPALKQQFIPQSLQTYALRIPSKQAMQFEAKREEILAYAQSVYNPQKSGTPAPEIMFASLTADDTPEQTPESKSKNVRYTVRKGDNLGSIARKYGVTTDEIKSWNGIRNNVIRVGERITIKIEEPSNTQLANNTEKQNTTPTETANKANAPAKPAANKQVHVVQHGDTLYSIARKYAGLSVEEIKKTNNIKDHRAIKPGMILVISKG